MPRYDYKCKKCGKSFETVHGIDDNAEECEFCGGPVRRIFHPVGIVFKGPGFYATDSRKGGSSAGSSRFKHHEEPHESAAKAKSDDDGGRKEGSKEGEKEKKPAEKTKPKPS